MGNLDARRDWGHAKDYVKGMWMILQHNKADDFILATGKNHTVRELVERSFKEVGIIVKWKGSGYKEVGINVENKKVLVKIDKKYFRPTEVEELLVIIPKLKKS